MSGETISADEMDRGKGTATPTKYVKLNVGGSLFYTTLGTLTKRADSMLRAMFSGRMEVLTDTEGWVLIDRSGKHFGSILDYLRDGKVPLPDGKAELKEFLTETKFYCLQELANEVEEALKKKGEDVEPQCQVPLVTSQKEERTIILKSEKPVIKLVCNRYNNKYSYTSQSDENILKNLELFDKLCLRFNGRILFIKDVIATDEICCWMFYGNGKKVTEVCCTSIVYATERKHTKVEFPEARIYEDTLNILLFEGRGDALDHELLRATKTVSKRPDRGDDSDDNSGSRRHRALANDI